MRMVFILFLGEKVNEINLNPVAFNLWIVGASGGYAIHGMFGAAIGLCVASALTVVISILP